MTRRAHLALKCLFAAGSLWLLLHFVPAHGILDVLANASGPLVAAGLALQFANRGLATIPLRIITASQGIDLGRAALFRIVLAVQFYALALPGALAGGGATWLKYLEYGAGKGAAAASVAINRGIGLLVLVPIGSVALMTDPHIGHLPPAVTVGLTIAGPLALCLFWSRFPPALLPRTSSGDPRSRMIRRGAERVDAFQRLPARARAIVLAAAIACELGNAAALWTFARAVGVTVDYQSVLWIRGLLQLALLLPLSIGGLGIREASLVALGSLAGVSAPEAVAWSLTILAGSTGVALAGGIMELGGGVPARTAHRIASATAAAPPGGRD